MSTLFDVEKFLKEIEGFNGEYKKRARDVMSQFLNYEVPIVTITRRRKDEVGIIFERINNTGTSLTTLDLMIAWT